MFKTKRDVNIFLDWMRANYNKRLEDNDIPLKDLFDIHFNDYEKTRDRLYDIREKLKN